MLFRSEVEKLKTNLEALNVNNNRKTAVLRLINNRLRSNNHQAPAVLSYINKLRSAVNQKTNVMTRGQAIEELRRLNVLLRKVGSVNNKNLESKITNYRRRLNAKSNPVSVNETGKNASRELMVNVPGTNTKVKVVRKNVGSNWNFATNANKKRYNLNNRNANVPKVRNISTGSLFE